MAKPLSQSPEEHHVFACVLPGCGFGYQQLHLLLLLQHVEGKISTGNSIMDLSI